MAYCASFNHIVGRDGVPSRPKGLRRAVTVARLGSGNGSPYAKPAYDAWYKTARWRRLRAEQLRIEPLCAMCLPVITIATVCDHVDPHGGDEVKFWSGPFQSLCKPCHDGIKQSQERRARERGLGG